VFRTEGARAGEGGGGTVAGAFARMAAAMRLIRAVGRQPPAMFGTEGAHAGEGGGGTVAGAFARRLPSCG